MAIDKTIKLDLDAEDVIKKLDKIEKELEGVKKGVEKGTEEMGNLTKSTTATTQGMTSLASGIGVVALALKALAISGIMRAFDMFFTILQGNQKVLDATNKAFETMSIFTKELINDITRATTSGVVKEFFNDFKNTIPIKEMTSAVINATTNLGFLAKALKTVSSLLGFDQRVKDAKNLADEIVNLRNEVQLAEAEQRKLQFTYLKEAELQRQIRDDVSKTVDERIEANNKLGKILQEQFTEEEKLALKRLELAQLELTTDEENIQLRVALTNAETEHLDLQERIVGQTSEQKVNETALNDERIANMQELSSIGKTELDRQINDIEIQAEQKRILAHRTISDENQLQATLDKIDADALIQKQKVIDEQEKLLIEQKGAEEKIRQTALTELKF